MLKAGTSKSIHTDIHKKLSTFGRNIKDKRSQLLWYIGPVISFVSMEYMIGNITLLPIDSELSLLQVFLNLIWYYMISGAIFLLVGRRNLSAGISATLFWILGNIETYVYRFRWRVIFPSDLYAAETALSVMDNYDFTPSSEQIVAAIIHLVYLVFLMRIPRQRKRELPRTVVMMSAAGLSAAYIAIFAYTPFLNAVGLGSEIWESMWDTKRNGILLNFTINLKNSNVEKPDGYSKEAAERIANTVEVPRAGNKRPNVIAIMNAAFSDISVLGDVKTNADCMPFIYSLSENTVKGYAYSSVFGGHTANSEYEFITGNTMAFLPAGTVAYQMFVDKGDYSLGSYFNSLGYHTTFMHPYYSSGWNRAKVYRNFGFDKVMFQNDFLFTNRIRDYISDTSNYNNLIREYELSSKKEPVFIFNVTMQNHGGYSAERENLDESVFLTGDLKGRYENVDTYLSLIRETDNAFREFVTYFSEQDEPTIIILFGDHQPNLGSSFYETIMGKPQDMLSLKEASKMYKVPFVIWANYDIKEKTGIETSINYLSSLMLKTAGLPLTGYHEFLSELSDQIPVITNIQFRDKNGVWTNKDEELSDRSQYMLKKYRILQYNGISDNSNRVDDFFFLP